MSRLNALFFYNTEALYHRNRIEEKLGKLGVRVKRAANMTACASVDLGVYDVVLFQEEGVPDGLRKNLLDRAAREGKTCFGIAHQTSGRGWDRVRDLMTAREAICGVPAAVTDEGVAVLYRRTLQRSDVLPLAAVREASPPLPPPEPDAPQGDPAPAPQSGELPVDEGAPRPRTPDLQELASAAEESERLAQLYAEELEVERAKVRALEDAMSKTSSTREELQGTIDSLRADNDSLRAKLALRGTLPWSRAAADVALSRLPPDAPITKLMAWLIKHADADGFVTPVKVDVQNDIRIYNQHLAGLFETAVAQELLKLVEKGRPSRYLILLGRQAAPRAEDQRKLEEKLRAMEVRVAALKERARSLEAELLDERGRALPAAPSAPLNGSTKKARAILTAHREEVLTSEEALTKLGALLERH